MCVCMPMHKYVHLHASDYRGQKKVPGPLELKLPVVMILLTWILGIDSCPLKEQHMLLNAEPSVHSPLAILTRPLLLNLHFENSSVNGRIFWYH